MRISPTCNTPTSTDPQLGCISLIFIACTVTATALALLLVGLLAWRQRSKTQRARQLARQHDIELEERAFSADVFVRTESLVSDVVEPPPSYRSWCDDGDVMVVMAAPVEGTLSGCEEGEKKGGFEGAGSVDVGGADVGGAGGAGNDPMTGARHDSLDLSFEDSPVEKRFRGRELRGV